MKTTLLSILLSVAALIRAAAGNDGLNILQAEYSKPGVAESFAAGKAWFPFPAYEDRAGWAVRICREGHFIEKCFKMYSTTCSEFYGNRFYSRSMWFRN